MADDIQIKVSAVDGGASAILKRIRELLGQLTDEQKRGLSVSVTERSERAQLAESTRRSEAAVRSYARTLRDQTRAMREQATAIREANTANRERARALQQATQAAIESSRAQRTAMNASTEAMHQSTQAAIKGAADRARADQLRTRVIAQSAAQATRSTQQATQAQLASTRAITQSLRQQTAAQLQASSAATRAASAQVSASNRAAAAQHAAANVQVAQINAQARAQASQLSLQREIVRQSGQMRIAQIQSTAQQKAGAVSARDYANALGALAVRIFAQVQLARGFIGFVKAGFEFNETIRQATLGIGALITAQAKLFDSQGRLLEGSKALDAAMAISEQQVTQLRIAGLQTAATTEQLVTAFQQAVGPGLRSGLNLDQIRKFTVGVTQAAAAIGLPMHQLNEEVRSLLAGTITYNTRIAKTLGISNALVSKWKEQGVFAERLIQRFNQFAIAGERSMQNMSVLLSNLKEGLDVFAGAATKPLFDAIRKEGNAALNAFFDFDKGQISEKFSGIVKIAQDVFASIGGIMVRAIQGAIGLVQRLSDYFQENRVAVDGVVAGAQELATQMARVIGQVARAVLGTLSWAARTGVLETLMRSVARITQLVADVLSFIITRFNSPEFASGMDRVLTFLKWTPVGVGFRLVAAGLGALGTAMGMVDIDAERLQRSLDVSDATSRENALTIHRLAVEYDVLRRRIDSGKLSADALSEAKVKLKSIVQQLVQFAPQYSQALTAWGADAKQTADEIKKLELAQGDLLLSQFEVARVREDSLQKQIDLERDLARFDETNADRQRAAGDNAAADASEKRAKQARENLSRFEQELSRAHQETENILDAVNQLNKTSDTLRNPTKIVPLPDEKDPKKNNDFRQMTEAAIKKVQDTFKRAKDELDRAIDQQEIGFADYTVKLMDAERTAITQEIALRTALLKKTTDPGEQAKIVEDIRELNERREHLEVDAQRRLIDLAKAFNEEMAQVNLQQLRQEERMGDARRIELEQQYAKLRRTIIANMQDVSGLDTFIRVEVARAKLEELQRIITRATTTMGTQIEEVNALAAKGMISTAEQARLVGDAYETEISAIERALPALRQLAEASKSPDAVLQVQALELELAKLREAQRQATSEIARYTEIALGGLQSGLADAFGNIGTQIEFTVKHFDEATGKMVEETKKRLYSLRDFARDVSLSILKALQQQLAQEFAQNVTNAARGALGKIGIHIGTGDTTAAVLQQSAAKSQIIAATTNTQASTAFAAAIAQLQAMVPGLLAVAQGGSTAQTIGNATVKETGAVVGDGADEAAQLTAATALETAGSALIGASATLGTSMVPAATALSGAAAALSAAAAALSAAAASGGVAGATQLTNQIASFSRGLGGGGAQLGGAAPTGSGLFGGRGISGPRRSIAVTTTDSVAVMPSFSIPDVSSPRTSRFAAGGTVDATLAALSARAPSSGPGAPVRVQLDVRSNDSHILAVQKSDPGAAVTLNTLRRNRRSAKGLLG